VWAPSLAAFPMPAVLERRLESSCLWLWAPNGNPTAFHRELLAIWVVFSYPAKAALKGHSIDS
jgi:hypothetical protein